MGRPWAGCSTCGGAWIGRGAGVGACDFVSGAMGIWIGASAGLGGAVGGFFCLGKWLNDI